MLINPPHTLTKVKPSSHLCATAIPPLADIVNRPALNHEDRGVSSEDLINAKTDRDGFAAGAVKPLSVKRFSLRTTAVFGLRGNSAEIYVKRCGDDEPVGHYMR